MNHARLNRPSDPLVARYGAYHVYRLAVAGVLLDMVFTVLCEQQEQMLDQVLRADL